MFNLWWLPVEDRSILVRPHSFIIYFFQRQTNLLYYIELFLYSCPHTYYFSLIGSPSIGTICLSLLIHKKYILLNLPCSELNIHVSTDFPLNQSPQCCSQKRHHGKIWWMTACLGQIWVWLCCFPRLTLLPLYSDSHGWSSVMGTGVIPLHLRIWQRKKTPFP